MKNNVFAAGTALVIACSLAVLGFAADKASSDDGKAAESKAPMYSAKCPSPCEFSVKSHDKAEVVTVLKEHAKTHHQMDLSDKDAAAMVKEPKSH